MKISYKIVFLLLFIFWLSSPVLARREVNYQKACFSNMRVLQGALEMYNMDNNEMLHEINEDAIDLLKKGKYLKGDRFFCPYKNEPGHYHNQGDLCEDGVIYCDYHGSVENYGDGRGQVVPASREYQMERGRREFQEKMNTFLPIIIVIGFVVVIIMLFSGNKKKR
jgi:hypothetical protein